MLVLSHRGYWLDAEEKNSRRAFIRTVENGFGTETDVRDHNGSLVISHDVPVGGELRLAEVIDMFQGSGLTLALNIKADGLGDTLAAEMARADFPWFAFDMSVPETFRYYKMGLPYFTRCSDIEPFPVLYEPSGGIWLDAFESEWYGATDILSHLERGKSVCVVSSELHGREPAQLWSELRQLRQSSLLMLCTDHPREAVEAICD